MMNLARIPEHMRDAVLDYVNNGREPGGFLGAVLTNNLVEAFSRADHINTEAMRDWAHLLYWELPCDCWGSEEIVEAWIEEHRAQQTKAKGGE